MRTESHLPLNEVKSRKGNNWTHHIIVMCPYYSLQFTHSHSDQHQAVDSMYSGKEVLFQVLTHICIYGKVIKNNKRMGE